MLKVLRTNTKWIMIIVCICFIGMIIFAWGMDITGSRTGVSAGIVGKVNDEEIPYTFYDNLVKSQREMYSGDIRITLAQERRIHDEVWDYIVTQIIIAQDIKKYNISYTDRELVNFIFTNPVQIAYQIPMFQENDTFSLTKYQAFLKNPDTLNNLQNAQLLQYIESEASNRLPILKFQERLTNTVTVTEAQVRERWLRENEKRKAEWVFIMANSLTKIATTVDPGEVQMYFEKHKEDYARGERRVLDAVFFDLAPAAEDSSDVLARAQLLVSRIRNGEDFGDLANEYSDDPGNTDSSGERRSGDLGFFGRGRMVSEFEKVAFGLKPEEVSDPILTQFGYHIIRVDSLKYKEDNKEEIDQVKARHILLNIEPSGNTRDMVENAVTAFTESVRGGMDFLARAQLDSLNVIQTFPFQRDITTISPIRGSSKLLVHRAFRAKRGELLPVFIIDEGFYVLRVAEIFEAGIPSFSEVRAEVEIDARNSIRALHSQDIVHQLHARLGEGKSLTEVVEADSVQVAQVQTAEVTRNHFIPGLGIMNTFIARIFKLENPGDTTGPVVTDSGSGIAVLVEKIPVDEDKYEKERAELGNKIESELKNEIVSRYMADLREQAEILDNRDMLVGY